MTIFMGVKAEGQQAFHIDGKDVLVDNVQFCILNNDDPAVKGFTAVAVPALKRQDAIRVFGTENFSEFLFCEVELYYSINMKGKAVLSKVLKLSDPILELVQVFSNRKENK